MRAKGAVAQLLAFLCLFLLSPLSPCTVKCSLHQLSRECHSTAPMQMACGPAMRGEETSSSAAVSGLSTRAAMPCEQQACVGSAVVNKDDLHFGARLSLLHQAVILTALEWPVSTELSGWNSALPTHRSNTPVSFHTVLRV